MEMDLGHEYRDDDGGGMGDGRVIDGEVLACRSQWLP